MFSQTGGIHAMSTLELDPKAGTQTPKAGVVAGAESTSEQQAEQALLETGGEAALTGTPAADQLVRRYWRLASRFWTGETRRAAYLLSFGIVALIVLGTSVTVVINRWQAFFFNALERRDAETVSSAILIFFLLAMVSAAIAVSLVHVRMRLQLRWRQWLTERLTAQWLDEQRFYRLSIAAPEVDSPEFRIADDARIATEPVVDFAIGLFNALLAAAAFAGVLWYVGGSLRIESLGITIPAYFVIAVIVYAALTSDLMTFIGRPLIRRVEVKNEEEARLR